CARDGGRSAYGTNRFDVW
nr:immunoglobulin heavy chain junction region [Macaca mulatta]MOW23142.1 immunoglobulin heavy chain junction region [Macaca mulatta]MOW23156.1 immunoglobulin heavy chain junction region [Macaca mulatta]MOW23173.1 immunoglobulin heavy chain junction region [Macaca mulatta]MOW23189.1 immunoglobulin heavy chain junction region [Macaca mulatta]